MKRSSFIIAILALAAGIRSGETGELSALVETVVRRNPAVRAMDNQADAARQGLREARALSVPRIRAESVLTRGDNPVYAFGTLLSQRAFEARYFDTAFLNHPGYLTNIRSSLEIGVPVFTGFALRRGRAMASLQVQQAESRAEGAAQAARLQISEAYLRALLINAQLESVQTRIAEAAREIEDADRLKSKGLVLGSDYFAAEAVLEGLRAWAVRLSAEKQAASSQIAILSGQAAPDKFRLKLSSAAHVVDDEKSLAASALRARADAQTAGLQTLSAALARRMETAAVLPRVEAFGSVATHTEDFSRNPSDRMAGVKASLAFADPVYAARREKAALEHRAALSAQAGIEESIRIEVARALAGYRGAAESLGPAGRMTERARKSLELFRPLYREGRQSILDVLRAEEGLARAESAYQEALYELHAGYARLMAAAGALDARAVADIESRLEAAE